MRVLIYAMPSSGASLFATFLAQIPDSIAVIDLWSVAPAFDTALPVIIKATINCEITLEDHYRRFRPELRILFLRDPAGTYQSLTAKHYKDIRGTIPEKLQVLDRVFARRAELFDLVVTYENLIHDPSAVAAVLRGHGLEIPATAAQFPRGPQQIARFATEHSGWCRENYLRQYGFGNLHFMDWGALKQLDYPPLPDSARIEIAAACPLVEAWYARRSHPAAGSAE